MSTHPLRASGPLWWADLPAGTTRPSLTRDESVDVAIVGAGFTGLWTAYYLLLADPSLRVLVLEAEHVGFGASGRNGGWVSALYPVGPAALARDHGEDSARDQYAALRESIDEIGRVAEAEGIECGFRKGGTLVVATHRAQEARGRAEAQASRHWGTGTAWLPASAAADRLAVKGLRGATFNPNCARIHPFRLALGLAQAVESKGARIHERTAVASLGDHGASHHGAGERGASDRSAPERSPGERSAGERSAGERSTGESRLRTADGFLVRARHVIRATEAWTARLPGLRRAVAPVYSLVVATAPLAPSVWDEIGLGGAETFSEHRHVVVYGQRSVDDRIVFGGRGAPYHFGSGIKASFDVDPRVFTRLRRSLNDLIPATEGVEFTHAWGGPLGVPRDWHPGVGYDPSTGQGFAGGYVGDGVALSNLAGRTLADLVTSRDTALTRLPWVQHHSRRWEPEPLRWLGVNAGLRLATLADHEERLTGRPALLATALSALTSH